MGTPSTQIQLTHKYRAGGGGLEFSMKDMELGI
jgi:hypothetical protein